MPNCKDCKFSEWAKKSNGHINPHAAGRCTWSKKVRVADSSMRQARMKGNVLELKGGYIWRDDGNRDCPVFERE